MPNALVDNDSSRPSLRGLPAVSATLLRVAGTALVAVVWASATLFGLYILAFYGGALASGKLDAWNEVLPRLYEPHAAAATSGLGLHFIAGGIILMLGCIQLIEAVRVRRPALHRWIGRFYIASALGAGVGGLTFIAVKGTIGGIVMDLGFGLYGVLMVLAAVQTLRFARARQLEAHRAWALRLFALAIGSWLYRMDYGFWLMLADGAGHSKGFRGPFDAVMSFFFYVPNLLVAELFIRLRRSRLPPWLAMVGFVALAGATCFLLLGTYYFTRFFWGPALLSRFGA